MGPDFSRRQGELSKLMERKRLDSVLISSHKDVQYYTGYPAMEDDSVFALMKNGEATLLVSTLSNEAPEIYPRVEFLSRTKDLLNHIRGSKKLGFDEGSVTVRFHELLKKSKPKLVCFGTEMKEPRMIKDSWEIAQLEEAIRVTGNVFRSVSGEMDGRTEEAVAFMIKAEFLKNGAERSFEPIVATGIQSAFIHHTPNRKTIGDGLTILDIGCYANGYSSDITRTYPRGPGKEEKKICSDNRHIFSVMLDSMRAGQPVKAIEKMHGNLLEKMKYKVLHSFGHGIGLSYHEPLTERLKEGMVVTLEPGIYVKGVGGSRIEDMLLIKKGKPQILSSRIPVPSVS